MKEKLKDKSVAVAKNGQKLKTLTEKSIGQGEEEGTDKEVVDEAIGMAAGTTSKAIQRKRIRREQIKAAKKKEEVKEANNRFRPSKRFVDEAGSDLAESIKERIKEFLEDNPRILLIAALVLVLLFFVGTTFTSCSAVMGGITSLTVESSYTASDRNIIAVDNKYKKKEKALQKKIDTIEITRPGYDEYRYDVAGIGHDPYELAALLTVLYEDYTQAEVAEAINTIFNYQYQFTTQEITETRYRTETRTGTVDVTNANGEISTESYSYTVEVPYDWHVLKVSLTNGGIDDARAAMIHNEDLNTRYTILNEMKGNKPDIFGDNIYVDDMITEDYEDYDVPPDVLSDEQFAKMHEEAEKYLGYPYVWGGSNPEESFDCSGFVCYVINHCGNGWNVGRTTANGLKQASTKIRPANVKAGDLIFFKGTYATGGASHVGIVVDPENKIMIHCGSPISYASYDTSYWRAHFYCYGRIK